ncbi:MAG: hypothetical protein EZS28_047445 [Streblomastix strix]|uniref:Uncharacterized protein n=1 Tax=Streblomastix strix TaxID=222440 RepID=A0A5J4TFW7_9EUKA|nr:MAG: hypothetical protein EZS28_047445 [Streblomastix strix]
MLGYQVIVLSYQLVFLVVFLNGQCRLDSNVHLFYLSILVFGLLPVTLAEPIPVKFVMFNGLIIWVMVLLSDLGKLHLQSNFNLYRYDSLAVLSSIPIIALVSPVPVYRILCLIKV